MGLRRRRELALIPGNHAVQHKIKLTESYMSTVLPNAPPENYHGESEITPKHFLQRAIISKLSQSSVEQGQHHDNGSTARLNNRQAFFRSQKQQHSEL